MPRYERDARVTVHPFTRQAEGGEVVIGHPRTSTFLAVPEEAVEALDLLATGTTVGEVQDRLAERYGEVPEMQEFLGALESSGFVAPAAGPATEPSTHTDPAASKPDERSAPRFHFEALDIELCRRLTSRPVLLAVAALVALTAWLVFRDPALIPGPSALVFEHHSSLLLLAVAALTYSIVFVHELGHVVAARAVGVPSRLGIGNRLWILVAEADLTGLWSVPRRERYLPFLAGPLVDLVALCLFVALHAADRSGVIPLGGWAGALVRGMIFAEMIALAWQTLFFLRTDLYYVITTAWGCKNLMDDTETWLKNLASRLVPRLGRTDQGSLPRRERTAIRAYAVIWVLGRLVALGILGFVTLPIAFAYLNQIVANLRSGSAADPYRFLDAMTTGLLLLVPLALGLTLWVRGLLGNRKESR